MKLGISGMKKTSLSGPGHVVFHVEEKWDYSLWSQRLKLKQTGENLKKADSDIDKKFLNDGTSFPWKWRVDFQMILGFREKCFDPCPIS